MERRSDDLYKEPVLVPHDDPVLLEHYYDIVTVFPQAMIVRDEYGTIRFRENRLMSFYCNAGVGEIISVNPYRSARPAFPGAPSLNDVVTEYFRGKFSYEELMMFYQDIGYSLSGYLDIFSDEVARMCEEGLQLLPGCVVRKAG